MKQSLQHWIVLVILWTSSVLSLQAAQTNAIVLTIQGEVDQPLSLTLADLQAMPRVTIKVREKDGDEASFEGVALSDVIQRAKPRLTEKCCGNAANTVLVVRATDNYRAVFSLAEIQSDFTDRKIVLVDRREGKPLSESQGPLRLIVPAEKIHARWVRQVKSLEIVTLNDKPR